MCGKPCFAHAHGNLHGNGKLRRVFHFKAQNFRGAPGAALRRFHYKLVVNLHNELRVKAFLGKAAAHSYHGDFDYVRSGSLNGHIAGNAFAERTHGMI